MRSHDRGDSWQPQTGAAGANSVLALTSCASSGRPGVAGRSARARRPAFGGRRRVLAAFQRWPVEPPGLGGWRCPPDSRRTARSSSARRPKACCAPPTAALTWSRCQRRAWSEPSVTSLAFSPTYPGRLPGMGDRRGEPRAKLRRGEGLGAGGRSAGGHRAAEPCQSRPMHPAAMPSRVGGVDGALTLSHDGGSSWLHSAERFAGQEAS